MALRLFQFLSAYGQGRLEEARPLAARLATMAAELMRLADGLSPDTLRDQAGGAP